MTPRARHVVILGALAACTLGAAALPEPAHAASVRIATADAGAMLRAGAVGVRVRGDGAGPVTLRTRIASGRRSTAAGSRRVDVPPGTTRTVRVGLSARARAAVARCTVRSVVVSARGDRAARRVRPVPGRCPGDPARKPRAKLTWAPPRLKDPETIRLGSGPTVTEMDPRRDYVVVLPPRVKRGATTLKGGRNVVLIGGEIELPPNARWSSERRGIYVKDNAGTVHIEGVLIRGRGVGDGIAISAPRSTVQIQNSRIAGLRGSYEGWHADVVQPWGGVRALRVDRLTGSSNYQGLQIPPDAGPIGTADIRNVNLFHTNHPPATGGYLLWLAKGVDTCTSYPLRLRNVRVEPKPGRSLADSVWPPSGFEGECAARSRARGITWPGLRASGAVRMGPPAGGDVVPRGVAGLGYLTPGYRASPGPVPLPAPLPQPEELIRP